MIDIIKRDNYLLLKYVSEQESSDWVFERLEQDGEVRFASRVFTFTKEDLVENNETIEGIFFDEDKLFILGELENGYFKINKEKLNLKHDLFLCSKMRINKKTFLCNNVSVFRKIDDLIDENIIIGGENPLSISKEDFYYLLDTFPTPTELKHYIGSRITGQLQNYFETMQDSQEKLSKYIKKRKNIKPPKKTSEIEKYDIEKFELIYHELSEMLKNKQIYTEEDWQKLIADFLPFIFPKYIKVLTNLSVKDSYTNPKKTTTCFIDYALVDNSGAIDVVEIKKPFDNCILSHGKYRRNFIPHRELSGAIMQAEKYIFHLSKWGQEGERKIESMRKAELPSDFKINIINPKGLIILGVDSNFSNPQQFFDFEVIRRKYANMIDIITYNDLLRRLKNTIFMLQINS